MPQIIGSLKYSDSPSAQDNTRVATTVAQKVAPSDPGFEAYRKAHPDVTYEQYKKLQEQIAQRTQPQLYSTDATNLKKTPQTASELKQRQDYIQNVVKPAQEKEKEELVEYTVGEKSPLNITLPSYWVSHFTDYKPTAGETLAIDLVSPMALGAVGKGIKVAAPVISNTSKKMAQNLGKAKFNYYLNQSIKNTNLARSGSEAARMRAAGIKNVRVPDFSQSVPLEEGFLYHSTGGTNYSPSGWDPLKKKFSYIQREVKPGALEVENGYYRTDRARRPKESTDYIWWDSAGHNRDRHVFVKKQGETDVNVLDNLEDLDISKVRERYAPSYYVTEGGVPTSEVIHFTKDPISGAYTPHMPDKILTNKMSLDEILSTPKVINRQITTPSEHQSFYWSLEDFSHKRGGTINYAKLF